MNGYEYERRWKQFRVRAIQGATVEDGKFDIQVIDREYRSLSFGKLSQVLGREEAERIRGSVEKTVVPQVTIIERPAR